MDDLAQSSLTDTHNSKKSLDFEFRGNGSEYFKIWIVNILLTVLTLGVYSAWAKVRNHRYFYSNLYINGSNFRYLAHPITILKGRIIAVIALIVYSVVATLAPTVSIVLSIVLFLVIPYFVVQSLSFDRRMTSYKNIQFRFKAAYREAFMVLYVWPLLGILTLGILMPYSLLQSNRFMVKNSAYGTTAFNFEATYKDFGVILLTILGIGLVFGSIATAITFLIPSLSIIAPVVMTIAYLSIFVYSMVSMTNLFYCSSSLGEHRFEANLSIADYCKVVLINAALILITIGLYAPAAKVRMTRYVASCVCLHTAGPLDQFVAAEQQNVSVLGEELGEVFDFGV